HLNGRLIFHRVPEDGRYRSHRPDNPQALRHKLEIKPDTPYYDWLENEIVEHYDYTCCETMAEFDRAQRAITRSGLSKSGGHRYEKADRRRLDDRRTYILGWHNKDKIRALEEELAGIEQRLRQERSHVAQAKADQEQARKQQVQLNVLLAFTDFAQLDWR